MQWILSTQVQKLEAESKEWVTAARIYLSHVEDHRRKMVRLLGPRTQGTLAVARAVQLLRAQKQSDLGALVAATITLKPEHCKCDAACMNMLHTMFIAFCIETMH